MNVELVFDPLFEAIREKFRYNRTGLIQRYGTA